MDSGLGDSPEVGTGWGSCKNGYSCQLGHLEQDREMSTPEKEVLSRDGLGLDSPCNAFSGV